MSMQVSLALTALSAALAAFFGWRGARPPDFRRGPRLVPHRPLMLACATAAFLFLLHAMALLRSDGF